MRTLLPGKPQARLQAVCTGYWDGKQVIAYITGNAIVILGSADNILQTICDDDDTSLDAIAFDEASGKIASCAGRTIRIYKPYGQSDDALKWSLQSHFTICKTTESTPAVSWGISEELLVGTSKLALYSTQDVPEKIWGKELANPVKLAYLSYDSAYVASTGLYDRLVKVWRRLSFGSDDVQFDFTYLPHPQTVTSLRWRRPYHLDQTIENVLYTISADNVLRIWAATDPHGLQILQLWAQLDLQESIQPRSQILRDRSMLRYAFMIDFRDFTKATEHAVQQVSLGATTHEHALEHLIEVASRSPEICVVLDECGYMSAWGLENLGSKERKNTNIFNIAHVAGIDFHLTPDGVQDGNYVQFHTYCNQAGGNLNILLHHFDGKIEIFRSNLAHLFDPSQRSDRIVSTAVWTGHSRAIKKIVRNISGRAVVSRTSDDESIVWKHIKTSETNRLQRQSVTQSSEHIHRICVLRKGDFVVFLHHSSLTLWDCRFPRSKLLGSCNYLVTGNSLCILVLPEIKRQGSTAHIATISSKMKGIVWELRLPNLTVSKEERNGHDDGEFIQEFCHFDLGAAEDLAYILPVDPAGSPPVISGFLDTFARDVAISYTHSGILTSWTAKVDKTARKVEWLKTCFVETGVIEPALASGSSIRKAALVNSGRSELTIWDVRGAQLEYAQNFETQDSIQDLDWTSTPDDQSILAVGFRHRVLLLSQMRYDYLNKGPAWASIREIDIRDVTPHPIGDSTWLGDGNLLIGAGNQLFVYDRTFSDAASLPSGLRIPKRGDSEWDLFDVVTRLNGPLPVFHPQFLGQCILAGKVNLVQRILLLLCKALQYGDGDQLDNLLGMELDEFYCDRNFTATSASKKGLRSAFVEFSEDGDTENLDEALASIIIDKLTKIAIPQLSAQDQIHLADIAECIALVEKQRRSVDENAARFMLYFRQHALRKGRTNELNLSWREINWAYHSSSQDILADMVSHQFHSRMLWENARESGIFMWISDLSALRSQFEAVARNEYTKHDVKNPTDCSLFYLALKKKAVLQGLWRMAGWNREQSMTLKLLSNNFQDPKWKTVALKNAYALLGKHRFEYAAAFFLLADSLKDAVNVCLSQLKDLQLAIAITRVYEGDTGPVLKELLEEKVLPLAAQEGNRWLASWAFWMLHRRDMAVRALISPVYTLLETPRSPDLQAKLYLTDDPALVVLYSQLRQKTLQTLRGASKVTPKVEWAFVLHSARLYDRMGCDLLALDLVRNWEFLLIGPTLGELGDEVDPRRMLRRRSSLVVADLPVHTHGMDAYPGGQRHTPASVFEEPESSSLLDSFGF